MSDAVPVLAVEGLRKTFRTGFFRRATTALRRVDFAVRGGEVFGLLGPNGAGKTTTLKILLGLVHADEGDVSLFGSRRVPESMRRVGYLPENPYVYQYLTPLELLDLCGRLMGMDAGSRRRRAETLLERVGLAHARDRRIGKFSKGMMQRVGLAQALLHDPELLVLDEPMSGLDPIGRKEVRDLVLEERDRGKTLLFTSHILTDVELLCDRVVVLRDGAVAAEGTLDALLSADARRTEVDLRGVPPGLRSRLAEEALEVVETAGGVRCTVEGDARVSSLVAEALGHGAELVSVTPRRETLESLFVRDAVTRGP